MDYRDLDLTKKTINSIPDKRIFLLILFSIFAPFILKAQVKADIGLMSGVSYYIGDINTDKHFYNVSPFYSGFYRYNFHKRFSVKGGIAYTTLSANSSDFNTFISNSSLSFKSQLIDFSAVFEYNFWPYLTTLTEEDKISPYIFVGLNGFYNIGVVSSIYYGIPFGAGLKYNLDKRIGIGFEYSFRKSFTDMIDGSDFWNDELNFEYTKDWYSFLGVFVSYKFFSKRIMCPAYNN